MTSETLIEKLPKVRLLDLVINPPFCVVNSDAECQKWLSLIRMAVYELNNLKLEK